MLLVWNIKDGWEPLCKFLGKPVPTEPMPRENVTGDFKYWDTYVFRHCSTQYCIKYAGFGITSILLSLLIAYCLPVYVFYLAFHMI